MTSRHDPRDTGRHLLGPHVVGQRIVVRTLVPGEHGPTGGPALTDLLGVCVAWGDGACVVQTEDGGTVTIALAHIVSGKPVPPRPSVRHRVGVRASELRTASLWSSVVTEPLGDWVLRTDLAPVGRPRRRANSCLAMGDPGLPLGEAADTVRRWYAERGRPPYLQVELGGDLEQELRALGWVVDPTGDAEFRLGSVARVRRALPARAVEPDLDVEGARATAVVRSDRFEVARGAATVDGDWIGVHDVVVDPGHRRRGLATAVMGALLEWGAEQGATTAWLHVEVANAGARALYDGLGLAAHHTCRYLVEVSPTRGS